MGIKVEFNPDLALRKHDSPGRLEEECVPFELKAGETYKFLKEGQRNYWLEGEVPLRITDGHQRLSRPLASVRIIEATHKMIGNAVYTQGLYRIIEIYGEQDSAIHFEGMEKLK